MLTGISIWGSALLTGVVFGVLLQRTGFSTTFAFWNMINFKKDFTMFRIYLLSIIIAVIGANLLEDTGLLSGLDTISGTLTEQGLKRQAFFPLANSLGGFIFGAGTIFASGCASSTLYRCGEGFINAWLAFFGILIGISAVKHGWLAPLYDITGLFEISINGIEAPALWHIFGTTLQAKWITISAVVLLLGGLLFTDQVSWTSTARYNGYNWVGTALCIGLAITAAWWASAYWGGTPRGISFTGPAAELFLGLFTGDTKAGSAPEFSFMGWFDMTWAAVYVAGVPLGAFLSFIWKSRKKFKLHATTPEGMFEYFMGGCLMGAGSGISGGCNIGHGLTGLSTLALSSIITTLFIVIGTWTMFYLKVMRH